MQERKPVLHTFDINLPAWGKLETQIALCALLQEPPVSEVRIYLIIRENILNQKYPRPTLSKLLKLLESHEENKPLNFGIFDLDLPDLKDWLSISSQMGKCFYADDRIFILKQALKMGFRLSPEDTPLLLSIENSQNYPEVIEYFFDHESCTTKHIMCFYNRYHDKASVFCDLAIQHPKFPSTREEYFAHNGPSMQKFNERITDYYERDKNDFYQAPLSLLSHRPQLLSYADIKRLRKEFLEAHRRLNMTEEVLPLLRKGLLQIYKHPEVSFLTSNNDIDYISGSHALDLAAWYGETELFNLIYSHEDTSNQHREKSLKLAKVSQGNKNLIYNFSFLQTKLFYDAHYLLFYLGISDKQIFPREVILLTYKLLIEAGIKECIDTITTTNKIPAHYQHKNNNLTLFQKAPVSHEWLLERVEIGINNYLLDIPSPTEKGEKRGNLTLLLLRNPKLSTDCKLMITESILNEDSWFGNPRVKIHLNKVIAQYADAIKKAAIEFTGKYNLDLKTTCDNLISLIHSGDLSDFFAGNMPEKDLIEKISNSGWIMRFM